MFKFVYVCGSCGYKYDPEVGDPDNGILPGTAFGDDLLKGASPILPRPTLPANWGCPVCGAKKSQFSSEFKGFGLF